jgi:hypothetical protein
MESYRIEGHIDDQHRLSASVPGSVPPGPVTVWIHPQVSGEDGAGASWAVDVAREWADELSDTRQDVYTLADGAALGS